MSVEACAQIVERADPARFRAAMLAPVAARRVLFPLYAFNAEVARAPWVTGEHLIAEMRLQWWLDALDEIATGGVVRKHEVTLPLAQVLDAEGAEALKRVVAARRWDIYNEPFNDNVEFEAHIDATAGTLMWVAARTLGAADEKTVRSFAFATGVAGWFQAIPALKAAGRRPIPADADLDRTWVYMMSKTAFARLGYATNARKTISKEAGAALLSGWTARPFLHTAYIRPDWIIEGKADPGPIRTALRLARVSLRGWWA